MALAPTTKIRAPTQKIAPSSVNFPPEIICVTGQKSRTNPPAPRPGGRGRPNEQQFGGTFDPKVFLVWAAHAQRLRVRYGILIGTEIICVTEDKRTVWERRGDDGDGDGGGELPAQLRGGSTATAGTPRTCTPVGPKVPVHGSHWARRKRERRAHPNLRAHPHFLYKFSTIFLVVAEFSFIVKFTMVF